MVESVSRRAWIKRTGERTYLMRLNRYWCIDGSVGGSGAELINHCCEPNCKFARRPDIGYRHQGVEVVSLRDVTPGEELLVDYKFPSDSTLTPCYCGAATCRERSIAGAHGLLTSLWLSRRTHLALGLLGFSAQRFRCGGDPAPASSTYPTSGASLHLPGPV